MREDFRVGGRHHGLSSQGLQDVRRTVERSGLKGAEKQQAYRIMKAQVAAIERLTANAPKIPQKPGGK